LQSFRKAEELFQKAQDVFEISFGEIHKKLWRIHSGDLMASSLFLF